MQRVPESHLVPLPRGADSHCLCLLRNDAAFTSLHIAIGGNGHKISQSDNWQDGGQPEGWRGEGGEFTGIAGKV